MRLASYYNRMARWRVALLLGLCMAFLALTPVAFAADDPPGGQAVEVIVDPTWYDPGLGGINCSGDCSCIGPSSDSCLRPEESYYKVAAAILASTAGRSS